MHIRKGQMKKTRNPYIYKNSFKQPIYCVIYSDFVSNVSNWKKSKHSHPFSEIVFVKKGRGQIFINDQKYNVKYGDVIVYNPNDIHQEVSLENEEFKVYFVALKEIGSDAPQNIIGPDKCPIASTGMLSHKFENYFADIVEEMQNKSNLNNDLPVYLAGLLVVMVKKLFYERSQDHGDLSDVCVEVKESIDRDFCSIRNIDSILSSLYASKYYFFEKYKEMFGVTPLQYLKAKKIEYAKELLRNTDMKIAEIAAMVGYENELYFSRLFTRECGISATTYRTQSRQ